MIGEPANSGVVALGDWRRLFAAAIEVRKLEPWRWMEETDIFGVRIPGRKPIAFVSVMGMLGEYHAVAVYPGSKELHQFWHIRNKPDSEQGADELLEMAQIHAAFGSAKDLEARDRQIIKALGLKFRGANSWPVFRSTHPGYYPWFLEPAEVQLLTVALEQLIDIAPRVQKDPSILASSGGDTSILVREPAGDEQDAPWQETRRTFPSEAMHLQLAIPGALMTAARTFQHADMTLEVDVFPVPMQVGEKGKRPQLPFVLLAVDTETLFIVGTEVLTVETTMEAMWATIPHRLLALLEPHAILPSSIAVRRPWVQMVLDSPCRALGVQLLPKNKLPALTSVRRDLERRYGRR